jgi:Tol biopolymer transport system component
MLFLRDGSLFAQELAADRLELRGEPREIAAGVSGHQRTFSSSDLSVSASGDVLFPAEFVGTTTLVWRDRKGAILQSLPGERMYYEPAFAPDEKRLMTTAEDDSAWEVDVERGRAKRLSVGDAAVITLTWSPDGKRIFFWSPSGGKAGVASAAVTGGKPELLASPPRALFPQTFTPDGTALVLDGPATQGKDFDVWQLNLADRKITPLLSTPAIEVRLKFSPDGRFVCYTSDETGRPEIFVQTWPLSDGKWQITFGGGDQAFWRGDGKELFYLAPDGKLMSVQTDLTTRSFADPVALFQTALTPVSITGNRNQYLVPRDGQRFLFLESPNSAPTHLTLVQNFAQLLKK